MTTSTAPAESAGPVNPTRSSWSGLLITAVLMTVVLTILLGIIYPLVTMGVAQVLFNKQANGSLLKNSKGVVVGSSLIGQNFTKPQYFWGRLSATSPTPYNAANSGGSNLGPTNKKLLHATEVQAALIRKANGLPPNYVLPSDAVSSSASGLDPNISPAYAALQVHRVAKARGLTDAVVQALVGKYTDGRTLGILGEPRVRVLELNIALDRLRK